MAQWLGCPISDQGVPRSNPGGAHFIVALSKSHLPCLVLVEPRKRWTDDRLGRTDEAEDYFVPNVLSPRDLVFRPDNMDKTVPHNYKQCRPKHFYLPIHCRKPVAKKPVAPESDEESVKITDSDSDSDFGVKKKKKAPAAKKPAAK